MTGLLILLFTNLGLTQPPGNSAQWKGLGVSSGAPLPPAERFKPRSHGEVAGNAKLNLDVLAKLDIEMQRHVAAKNVAGISAIIHKNGQRGYFEMFGMADIDGKPMPFNSKPDAAYRVCMQRTCTQLVNGFLAKCPALAYWPQLETKACLESISEWDLFRDYESCPPTASDDELRSFFETKSIPQCALCPCRRVAFRHPSPLQRSNLQ